MTDEELLKLDNVPPETAGKYLGVTAQQIRYWLQDKTVDFGIAHKRKGGERYDYYISPHKLIKFKKGA